MVDYINEETLSRVMLKIRDFRAWVVANNIDAWTVRQALLMAVEMDTRSALQRGIRPLDILAFDSAVKLDINKWLDRQGH